MGGDSRIGVRARLSVMMAGVFAIQGCWWPLLAVHLADLHIGGRARGWIFATLAIASLLTPLGVGQLADRRVPSQWLMATLYALGTGLLAVLAAGWVDSAPGLFTLLLAYWLLTAPGYGLASAMAFRNLERPAEQFGGVRLWGTVSWMLVGLAVSGLMAGRVALGASPAGRTSDAFGLSAVLSGLVAVFCLRLPHTPPLARSSGGRSFASTAVELARRPGMGLFLTLAFGVSLTTPFVYQVVPAHLAERGLPRSSIAAAMSLGQVLEIGVLLVLPRVIGTLGYRATLALGLCAWVSYFGMLASRPALVVTLPGLALQGVAIALFHITGPLYLDRRTAPELRSSTQGLYVMTTTGLGTLIGSLMAGEVVMWLGAGTSALFLVPMAIDAVVLLLLLATFRDPERSPATAAPRVGPPQAVTGRPRESIA